MRRTIVALDSHVLLRLRERAERDGISLRSLVNSLLSQALETPPRPTYKLHMLGWNAITRGGADVLDRSALLDEMDGVDPFEEA